MAYKFQIRPQRQEKSLEVWSMKSLHQKPCAAQAGSADRPQRPRPPVPTLHRVRLSLPPLHQSFFILQKALPDKLLPVLPLSAAPSLNRSSLPRQPAASPLLSEHAGQLRLPLIAHARRFPSPHPHPHRPVWQTRRPLPLSCRERLAAAVLTSWLRPSRVVSVRTLVSLSRREACVLGVWCSAHGLSNLFLG